MKPSIGITNLPSLLSLILVVKFIWIQFHFNAKKYSWLKLGTCNSIEKTTFHKFCLPCTTILCCFMTNLKSCEINLLNFLSNPADIYLLEVKNGKSRKSMCEICSEFRGVCRRTQWNMLTFGVNYFCKKASL